MSYEMDIENNDVNWKKSEIREFRCPDCGFVSNHECKDGSLIDVWCQRCKNITMYVVTGGYPVVQEGD